MVSLLWLSLLASTQATVAAPFDIASRTTILTAHAEGAQIYECKAGADGTLKWTFREPIASLFVDGKTIGRHYAGPRWALDDGSIAQGKMVSTQPGETAADIAQLKLQVIAHQGAGALGQANMVYRVDTHGGALQGVCPTAGALRSVAYSAEYIFAK
jgi:hypothetical protein